MTLRSLSGLDAGVSVNEADPGNSPTEMAASHEPIDPADLPSVPCRESARGKANPAELPEFGAR